jgi:hypothetical protein
LLDATRTYLASVINPGSVSTWFPTLPIEWRIINVQANNQLLEHLSPGNWVSFEIVNLMDKTTYGAGHLPYFNALERVWKTAAGPNYRQHHGKSFGTGTYNAALPPYPFQNQSSYMNFYSSTTSSAFLAKMSAYDPNKLFYAGAALEYMSAPGYTVRHDPRADYGMSCYTGNALECFNSGAQCTANICTSNPMCSAFVPCPSGEVCNMGTCEVTQLPYGQTCALDAQCSSGHCCNNMCVTSYQPRQGGGAFCTQNCQCSSNMCFILICL